MLRPTVNPALSAARGMRYAHDPRSLPGNRPDDRVEVRIRAVRAGGVGRGVFGRRGQASKCVRNMFQNHSVPNVQCVPNQPRRRGSRIVHGSCLGAGSMVVGVAGFN